MNPLLAALVAAGIMTQAEAEVINRQLDDNAARAYAEQQMLLAFQDGLSAQRDRLVDAIRAADGVLSASQANRLWAGENDLLWASVRETILDLASERATVAAIHAGGADIWQQVNDATVSYAQGYYTSAAADNVGSIPNLNVTSRQRVGPIIAEWQQGLLPQERLRGLPDLIRNLEPVFGVGRAELVATTETTRIFTESLRAAEAENPYTTQWEWLTAQDELVCPICGPLAGMRVAKSATGFTLGTLTTFPPAHPRCRCNIVALTDIEATIAAQEATRTAANEAAANVAPVDAPVQQQAAPTGTPPFKTGIQEFQPFDEKREQSADHNALNQLAEKWGGTLTEDRFVAVRRWTDNWTQTRKNIAAGNIEQGERDLLDALETAPKIEGIVYRGINPGGAFQTVQDVLNTYRRGVGTEIEWDTVSSTSILPDVAAQFGNTVFEVKTKTARYINPLSKFYGKSDDEFEAVIMPNTKFRIVGVGESKTPIDFLDGPRERWVIQLEELP